MALVRHGKSPYWYYRFMCNGQIYFKSTKCKTKSEANKVEARARFEAEMEGRSSTKISLKEALDEFLEKSTELVDYAGHIARANKTLGFKFINGKQKIVFGFDGQMNFNELTNAHLQRLVAARKKEGNAAQTIVQELLVIKGSYDVCRKLGYELPNIDIGDIIKSNRLRTKKKQQIKYLTAEEEARLLAELDPYKKIPNRSHFDNLNDEDKQYRIDHHDFVLASLDLGCRFKELATLQWKDVDVDKGIVTLYRSKVGNESPLHMTDRLKAVMQRRRLSKSPAQVYVFQSPYDRGPYKYSRHSFDSACDRAGIEGASFHTLRKTCATKLVKAGVDLFYVSKVLGHSTVVTTQNHYADLAPSKASQVSVEVLNKLNSEVTLTE